MSMGLLLLVAPDFVSARIFKDAKGREMEAELLGFSGDSVVILRGAKEFTVKANLFSLDDQAYIKQWIASHPEAMRLDLRYSVSISTTGKKRAKTVPDPYLQIAGQKVRTSVTNQGAASLSGVRVVCDVIVEDYIDMRGRAYLDLYSKRVRPAKGRVQKIRGEMKMDSMPGMSRIDVDMAFPIELLSGNYNGKAGKALKDRILGVIVYVLVNGKQMGIYRKEIISKSLSEIKWEDKVEETKGLTVETKAK